MVILPLENQNISARNTDEPLVRFRESQKREIGREKKREDGIFS